MENEIYYRLDHGDESISNQEKFPAGLPERVYTLLGFGMMSVDAKGYKFSSPQKGFGIWLNGTQIHGEGTLK
jgi:hypothetical protein